MPTSPHARSTYTYPKTTTPPWSVQAKSSPLPPSVQTYNQQPAHQHYVPGSGSNTPSPPSSPSTTTGGTTYSIPGSSYASSSSSTRSGVRSRNNSSDSGVGLGISSGSRNGSDDALDYMSDRLASTTLDRSMDPEAGIDASTLHAKSLELAALQSLANARLARAKVNFADGIAAARETRAELEWAGQKVKGIGERVRRDDRYRDAYGRVDERVGRIVDLED